MRLFPLDALLSLSLYKAEFIVVVAALGPGLSVQAGRLAVGRVTSLGSWCAFLWAPGTFSI